MGEVSYKCYVCQKHFRRRSTLIKHLKIHTGNNLRKVILLNVLIKMCGKQFKNISSLRRHLKTHTGESCENCEVCEFCGKQ